MKGLLYFSPLFLYFPRIPGGSETQPILTVLLIGLMFLTCKVSKQISILIAVGLMILSLLPSLAQLALNYDLKTSLSSFILLLGPMFLFGLMTINAPPPSRKSLAFACIFFIGIAFFEIFFGNTYEAIASELLPRATVFNFHRGVSLLTPEPTYATISMIYLIFLSLWAGQQSEPKYLWIEPVLFILLALTFSMYADIFISVILLIKFPKIIISSLLILITMSIFVFQFGGASVDADNSTRVIVALNSLFLIDYSNFLTSISIADESLGTRVIANYTGYFTPSVAPLGLGLSCTSLYNAMLLINSDVVFSNPLLLTLAKGGCLKPAAYLPSLMLTVGYLGILFLMLLIYLLRIICKHLPIKFDLTPFTCAIILLTLQGQISSPIPWFL
ncbi:MAG: hypothetical protein ABL929_13295, partial [Ferruginibacter sp.]